MVLAGPLSATSSSTAIGTIWAAMVSWFSPAVLFVIINLVIGTIVVTSKIHQNTNRGHEDEHHLRPRGRLLSHASSLLSRLQSINLHRYCTEALTDSNPTPASSALQVSPTPTEVMGEEKREEEEYGGFETMEEAYAAATTTKGRDENLRSQSDSHPVKESTAKEKAKAKVMKRSTSTSTAMLHECEAMAMEEVEARRPKTVKEGRRRNIDVEEDVAIDDDSEVDARADDFINKFRKQLHLQRLDSILRYKEMLNRGK